MNAPGLRAKIVNALNLTPLVPPQADTETLNVVNDAWLALTKLMCQLQKAERERDHWEGQARNRAFRNAQTRADAAEAKLQETERDRDNATDRANASDLVREKWQARAEAAEAREKTLHDEFACREAALREALDDLEIAMSDPSCDGWTLARIRETPRLRAALAEKPETNEAEWRSGLWRNTR